MARGGGMKIFLSYAREDAEAASVIYQRLHSDNHTIFNWQAPENEGERFIQATEEAIKSADYFFAILSSSFLASYWCRVEREFALRREPERTGGVPFIHVLKIADVNPRDTGFLGNYSWRDMTTPELVGPALDALSRRITQVEPPSPGPGDPEEGDVTADARYSEPVFRNREDELDKVLRGLTNAAGPHFWLVVGPPQLGKTWFLERISKDSMLTDPPGWVINRVDLHQQSPEARADPDVLLGLMFGRTLPMVTVETLRGIAIEIIQSRRPHLCVLDSAELLDARTAARLRTHLGPIYRRVLAVGRPGIRLAVIVSSRQDDGWRGLNPDPRLSPLSLTEFNVDVVQQALRDMAVRTDWSVSESEYWSFAALAHSLTEGLPALLALCLQWIVEQEWMDLDRMAQPEIFRELAGPYIQLVLLTSESLFPGGARQGDEQLSALRYAYRLLSPYRLFTQSHLRHHLERDPDLTDILGRLGWSLTDLWQAISSTALLIREPSEPWKRIYPAVRRLLYRYFYEPSDNGAEAPAGGVEAHSEARRFIKVWAEKQVGTEQVVGLIECLWHDANVYLPDLPQQLTASARQLSEDLRPSEAFTLEELREYAVQLLRRDHEFQRAISCIDGLFDQLVEIVQRP
jgi:TIR domain